MWTLKSGDLKENGTGDEVFLTDFTDQEKMKFGEPLLDHIKGVLLKKSKQKI
jgi:hypothetical protein